MLARLAFESSKLVGEPDVRRNGELPREACANELGVHERAVVQVDVGQESSIAITLVGIEHESHLCVFHPAAVRLPSFVAEGLGASWRMFGLRRIDADVPNTFVSPLNVDSNRVAVGDAGDSPSKRRLFVSRLRTRGFRG